MLRFILVAILLLLSPIVCEAASCAPTFDRRDLWIAAQGPGDKTTYFKQGTRVLDLSEIHVGDVLRVDRDINLRSSPGDFAKVLSCLSKEEAVRALEFKIEPTKDGDQTWIRVTAAGFSEQVPDKMLAGIAKCYNAGSQTVQSMYACSGLLLSPRTFLFCILEAGCPVYPDTLAGHASLMAALGPDQMNTLLVLDPVNLPKFPTAQQIAGCQSNGVDSDVFTDCVLNKMGSDQSGSHNLIVGCVQGKNSVEIAKCLAAQANNKTINDLVNCNPSGSTSTKFLASCAGRAELAAQIDAVENCMASSKDLSQCLSSQLSADQRKAVECLSNGRGSQAAAICLSSLNPSVGAALRDVQCASKATSAAGEAACIAPHLGGDAGKVANCVAGDKNEVVTCLVRDKPEYQAAQAAYNCIANGRDATGFIENCAEGFIKDDKTRQTLSCVAKAQGDQTELAACAAEAVLPPDLARYASCAATSDGPTAFALCAVGPQMNEEWRIAAECAVETGGNPVGWAGCTAGTLTVREITKCISGQVGKDCFGPNNTIRLALDNSFRDLTQGPGKNNEIVKAIDAIGDVTGGPNSIVNNPGQLLGGGGSIFHNPGQIAQGATDFLNKVVHITIPIPNISIPPIRVPNPPCQLQFKCKGSVLRPRCGNMC